MKKQILLCAALATVAGAAFAVEENGESGALPFTIELAEEGKVQIKSETLEKGTLAVEILNEKGRKVHANTIDFEGPFKQSFNLSKLKEGNYRFNLKGEGVAISQEVFNSKLHNEDVFASVVEKSEDTYTLKVLHDNVPVNVQIIDSNGRIRYNKTYVHKSNFTQDFKIINQKNSDLEMVISGHKSVIRKKIG